VQGENRTGGGPSHFHETLNSGRSENGTILRPFNLVYSFPGSGLDGGQATATKKRKRARSINLERGRKALKGG